MRVALTHDVRVTMMHGASSIDARCENIIDARCESNIDSRCESHNDARCESNIVQTVKAKLAVLTVRCITGVYELMAFRGVIRADNMDF